MVVAIATTPNAVPGLLVKSFSVSSLWLICVDTFIITGCQPLTGPEPWSRTPGRQKSRIMVKPAALSFMLRAYSVYYAGCGPSVGQRLFFDVFHSSVSDLDHLQAFFQTKSI